MSSLYLEVSSVQGSDTTLFEKQEVALLPPLTEFDCVLEGLSYHQLQALQKAAGHVRAAKYPSCHRNKKPLYGNLPKVFSDRQLLEFFAELYRFRNEAVYKAFAKQFFYGLRIGEINTCRLVPMQELVIVEAEKKKGQPNQYYLPLIKGTEDLFNPDLPKLSPHYLRKYFRETCDRLGDEYMFTYGKALCGRPLRQFSTHTLRATAGNMLRRHTRDPYKEAVYLRHELSSLWGATSRYMHYEQEEMKQDINQTFKHYVEELL